MVKVAIVGCGKIADAHASQIGRIKDSEIVAVCDRELLMARQIAERFPIKRYFSDLGEMLRESKPNVVHITTPPQTHFDIAKMCLESGCHVYVEKPFTLFEEDAKRLIELAESKNLKITAGHDDQFSHAARRMRALVQSGYLGDGVVHMESYYCYEISSSGYSGALLGDPNHWVRKLPGGLLQNIISHGIARVAEFLVSDSPEVIARGFVSPLLKGLGEDNLIDELRVIICDQERVTAYFTFSSQMRPDLHQFRIYGNKNGLIMDHDDQSMVRLSGKRLPSYAEKFIPPLRLAREYVGSFRKNFSTFMGRDFHMKSGMKYLIESFYKSIVDDAPLPISYREILLTAKIMDSIFAQLNERSLELRNEVQKALPVSIPQ
jgi:predicted dehydrogenase